MFFVSNLLSSSQAHALKSSGRPSRLSSKIELQPELDRSRNTDCNVYSAERGGRDVLGWPLEIRMIKCIEELCTEVDIPLLIYVESFAYREVGIQKTRRFLGRL